VFLRLLLYGDFLLVTAFPTYFMGLLRLQSDEDETQNNAIFQNERMGYLKDR